MSPPSFEIFPTHGNLLGSAGSGSTTLKKTCRCKFLYQISSSNLLVAKKTGTEFYTSPQNIIELVDSISRF